MALVQAPGKEDWIMYRYIDALNTLGNMLNQMDEPFQKKDYKVPAESEAWRPLTEIWETDKSIDISLDLPGIAADSLDVKMEGDRIVIKGERKTTERDGNCQRREVFFGRFYRAFEIPCPIDRDGIRASYKNGVLTVVLPKSDAEKPRQIKISVED